MERKREKTKPTYLSHNTLERRKKQSRQNRHMSATMRVIIIVVVSCTICGLARLVGLPAVGPARVTVSSVEAFMGAMGLWAIMGALVVEWGAFGVLP